MDDDELFENYRRFMINLDDYEEVEYQEMLLELLQLESHQADEDQNIEEYYETGGGYRE